MPNRSTFPNVLDTFQILQDLTPELSADADELQELRKISNKTPEQIARISVLLTELAPYYMSTETWNKLCDCMSNIENFTLEKFTNYYKYCQSYNNATLYNIFNSVTYTDGNVYLLYNTSPSYMVGVNPTNTTYWLKISQKGDKGDKGNQWRGNYDSATPYAIDDVIGYDGSAYICILGGTNKQPDVNPTYWQLFARKGYSGTDGIDGIGLVFKNDYSDITTYNKDNCVQYLGSLYSCKQDGVSGFIPTNATYWSLVVAKGGSVVVTTLRNTKTVNTNTSNVNFFGGEIVAFNPSLDSLFVYKNSTYLEKGQDYNINADGMSVDKITGSWDGSITPITFNFVVIKNIVQTINFNDGSLIQDGTIIETKLADSVKFKLNNNFFNLIESTFTATSDGTSNVLIGHSNYNPNEDKLTVKYMNEVLTKDLNYTINSDNLSIDLIDWTLDIDEVIYFEVIKRSLSVITEPDGSLIAEKTISEAKLSQDLQDKINDTGDLLTLNTTDKSNVVGAVNEVNDMVTLHSADDVAHLSSTEHTNLTTHLAESINIKRMLSMGGIF